MSSSQPYKKPKIQQKRPVAFNAYPTAAPARRGTLGMRPSHGAGRPSQGAAGFGTPARRIQQDMPQVNQTAGSRPSPNSAASLNSPRPRAGKAPASSPAAAAAPPAAGTSATTAAAAVEVSAEDLEDLAASVVEDGLNEEDMDALLAGVEFDETLVSSNASPKAEADKEKERTASTTIAADAANAADTGGGGAAAKSESAAPLPTAGAPSVSKAAPAHGATATPQGADTNDIVAKMEKLQQQLNRSQSRLKSMETKIQETEKEKDTLRNNLIASRNRPPDASMVQKVSDLEKSVETLTSSVTFKEQELRETDTKRQKVQKKLDAAEKELTRTKEEARAANKKRPHPGAAAMATHTGNGRDAGESDSYPLGGGGAGGGGGGGSGAARSGGIESSTYVVQAVFQSIATALAGSADQSSHLQTHNHHQFGAATATATAAAAADSAAHTTVAMQSLLEASDGNGLSIIPVLLDILDAPPPRAAAAAAGSAEDDAAPAATPPGEPAAITPKIVSALNTTYELVISSSSFRAAMLNSNSALPLHTGGSAHASDGIREVDDWFPHENTTDVVAAVAGDVVRFWGVLYNSLAQAASAGVAASAATASASASNSVDAGNAGGGTAGTAAAASANANGSGGGGGVSSSATVGGGSSSSGALNAEGLQAWAAVDRVLLILQALAHDCPQRCRHLFSPLFESAAVKLCIESGHRAVVLAVANMLKAVATMPCTTAWVQSDDGERALRLLLRHLSDSSIAAEAIAMRSALVQLLSNLAAVGGPLRMGEVISRPACSNEVITRLCMMTDVQFGYMEQEVAILNPGGEPDSNEIHREALFQGLYLFFALINSPIHTFLNAAKHPTRKNKICTTMTKLHRLAHAPSPRWGLDAFADEVADLADHFQLKL